MKSYHYWGLRIAHVNKRYEILPNASRRLFLVVHWPLLTVITKKYTSPTLSRL